MPFGRLGSLGRGFGHMGGGGSAAHVRQVATRCYTCYGFNPGATDLMTRSYHVARDNISALKFVYTNWYVDTNNNGNTWAELGPGAVATHTTGFETAGGAKTQVLFGGLITGSCPSGGLLESDWHPVSLTAGDGFFVRSLRSCSGGILYAPIVASSSLGDRFEFTATDKTISGTIADGLPGYFYTPTAIIARTRKNSYLLLGTSLTAGIIDVNDATGDLGVLARGIGARLGYINAGVPGDTIARLSVAYAKRMALAAYCTGVIVEHGINDAADSLGTKQANLGIVYAAAIAAGRLVDNVSIGPNSSSSDSWATTANQTVLQDLTTFNAWLRGPPAPVRRCYEIADVLMSSHDSNKWQVDGTPNKYTADGLHGSQFANQAILAANLFAAA